MRAFVLGLISVVWLHALPLQAAEDVSEEHKHLRAAAHLAVFAGNLGLIQELLKAGLQINSPVETEGGDSLLHLAVFAEKPELIRYLLRQGADPLIRNKYDHRPIDNLDWSKPEAATLLQALEHSLDSSDKTTLAGVPVPVWREVLGAPVTAPDPLEPPPRVKMGEKKMVQYISFKDTVFDRSPVKDDGRPAKDPPKEMEAMLNSRFPGWKPFSALDRQSKEPCESVRLTLAPLKSTDLSTDDKSPLIAYALGHPLPAYSFMVRTNHATLWRGGEYGYVVLVGGYWVKVAAHMFEE